MALSIRRATVLFAEADMRCHGVAASPLSVQSGSCSVRRKVCNMIKFGTGGWRAIIGDEFTKANVQLLTAAIAKKLIDEDKTLSGFVIGYDRRFLSEEATKWAAEVMRKNGNG